MRAMHRVTVIAGIAACGACGAGCAQLAGIDETSGDALPGNTATVQRMSIGNTVVLSPLDLTGLQASYLVANAASASGFDRVPATTAGGGTWTTLVRGATPVELTLPDLPTPL